MEAYDIHNILKKIQPFNQLEESVLEELSENSVIQDFLPGEIIYEKGSQTKEYVYIIEEGLIELFIINEDEVERAVSLCRPFDYLGETSILSDKHYPISSKAIMKSTLIAIPKDLFQKLLANRTEFASAVSYFMIERMHNLFHEIAMEQSQSSFGEDASAFRKKMADIMTSPVITCSENTSLHEIATTMSQNNISAMVVTKEDDPVGLITEHTLIVSVLTKTNIEPHKLTAGDIMQEQVLRLPPDAFFYQALLDMIKNQQKHILIMDDQELIGIVTLNNLVKSRKSGALTLVSEIERKNSVEGLIECRNKIGSVLNALVTDEAPPKEVFDVITEFYNRLTIKAIKIAELEMQAEGYGLPPVDYCWISMGSSGRKEQFTMTDQDNGIIYTNTAEEEKKVQPYFIRLGNKVVESLSILGFAKCKGNVMANNPKWCSSLEAWEARVKNWILNPEPINIRSLTTFLDFRGVYGTKNLADSLRKFTVKTIQENPLILHHLAKDDSEHKIPLGLFNRFITEKSKEYRGEIDLKSAVCVHIIDCLRVIAFKEGILETSTLERLNKIVQKNAYPKDDAEYLEAAYEFVMTLRIKEVVEKMNHGKPPTNHINPEKLSRRDQNRLRDALLAAANLQKFTRIHFAISDASGIPSGIQRTYTRRIPTEEEKSAINKIVDRFKDRFSLEASWDKGRFVVFEIKTTGDAVYGGDEIISISGFLIEEGKINQDRIFNELVNPIRDIPKEVTESTGITSKMVADKPSVYSVLADFLNFVEDSILVTYDAKTHTEFINFKLKRYCKAKLFHPVIDLCTIATTLYPLMHHFSFDQLLKIHKIPIKDRNTSLGDGFMSAQLFLKLIEYMKFRKIHTYKELLTYIQAHQALNFKGNKL